MTFVTDCTLRSGGIETAMAGTRILPQTARYLQRNLKPKMTPLPSNPVRIPKVMPLIVLQSISAYLTATATAVMVSVLAVKCLAVSQMWPNLGLR